MIPIRESGDTGEARRIAVNLAADLGFDEAGQGKVALVISEIGTNILKHAKTGEVVIGTYPVGARHGVEILAIDRGPGIADVERGMEDGYSTAGSPGTGLGAIRRQSGFFELYSRVGAGTVLVSRLTPGRAQPDTAFLRIGKISLPVRYETMCGDGWAVVQADARAALMVVDGLGHGEHAHVAAEQAVRIFGEHAQRSPDEILQLAHGALRSTRGAAGAVVEIRRAERQVRYAGAGNICASIATPQGNRSMVSQNGTLGVEIRRLQTFEYPWPPGATLIMHSDGLATHWNLESHPGIFHRDPSILAAVLYRDHTRGRDDVTVVVASEAQP